ncbi:hypothetical protein DES53_10793 [Roseimicrobium gellanilyticum]|uniref:Uncharacterized protein n=1 Tax=Roseimicrobium gellanilyticum TaxID=748857 RepID=A0A366HFA8_9BACT|nr:hypothetical protein [Roseimicrobium gellanilyticum]RBP41262.1 hypothetical protein DES53_10793 [Roseimicrobium gellanilyticum]
MQQNWNIKSRSHECSRSGRPFEEGEVFHTSIYFDNESGEFVRRDVALDVWDEELKDRTPLAYWRTTYVKPDSGKPKVEISSKESPESLLRRLIDEDQEHTEHARYILGLMLERKKQLVPKETKYTEQGTLLLYEHRKSGEVFIIRDPELRLDEIESVQEEVATLLGFGGPVVEAARIAGVTLTPDGKIEKGDAAKSAPEKAPSEKLEAEKSESEPVPGALEEGETGVTESETPESELAETGAVESEEGENVSEEPASAADEAEEPEAADEEVEAVEAEPTAPEGESDASSEEQTGSRETASPS